MDGFHHLGGWLILIPLLPFLGFVINGLLGKSLGKTFVACVGAGLPITAFGIALAGFCAIVWADKTTAVTAPQGMRAKLIEQLRAADLHPFEPTAEDRAEGVVRVADSVEDVRKAVPATTRVLPLGEVAPRSYYGPGGRTLGSDATWMEVAGFRVVYRLVLDRLSALLCLVVLGVGSLIHLYSIAYMDTEKEGGFARYFAYLNLFTAMMLVLVLAGDLLLMFVGWEGVGLSSYLLIGFEYKEGWKADAGIKAFVVNRVGDWGFILGVLALATASIVAGEGDLRIDHLNALVLHEKVPQLTLACAALCLFIGATGKSAQIPLYVWLPDAMAGPTPVSALIHAATMVTAGVYMVCRLHPVFEHAVFPDPTHVFGLNLLGGVPVLGIVAITGALTALFAATAACAQDDVKKVLAYSTVSQLGYMFIGAGVGAFGASVFHLVTHAFFKALLFLGAGALIHATGTQDLKRMGGLAKKLPVEFYTMAIGCVALAGLPVPFAGGYFSKDMILGKALEAAREPIHPWGWLIYLIGVIGGLITAFYSMRLVAFAFLGKPGRTAEHAHPSPPLMAQPLMVLAVLTLLSGLLGLPAFVGENGDLLPKFLEPAVGGAHEAAHGGEGVGAEHAGNSAEIIAMIVSTIAAFVGVFVGWKVYASGPMASWLDDIEANRGHDLPVRARAVLANAYGVDAFYRSTFVDGTLDIARGLWEVIDNELLDRGLVDGAGRLARGLGELLVELQNGRVVRYAAYVAVGVIALLAASVF